MCASLTKPIIFYELTIEDCRNNDCIYFVKKSYIRQSVREQSKHNVNYQLNVVASDLQRRYVEDGAWWRHQMETFSALLGLCAGNSPVTGEFPSQSPVTRSLDVFFDLRLNKRLSKQSRGWWFETPSRLLWRHCNGLTQSKMMVCVTR